MAEKCREVWIEASKTYSVCFEKGGLAGIGQRVAEKKICEAVVVTDSNVDPLYGDVVMESLEKSGVRARRMVVSPGEESKSIHVLGELLEFLAEGGLTKSGALIALGGGVVGDLTGFAAASFLRGVHFIQIPTTLLAVVDSSVGGKTAVNLAAGKNLAGAFYQPDLVLADLDTLDTLPAEKVADGLSEMVKYGVIADHALFAEMKTGGYNEDRAVRCVEIKRDFVLRDERDEGARQALNFGHTIGHAIERASAYEISHGHAVAIGMAMMARASAKRGWCAPCVEAEILEALRANGLPTTCSYSAEVLAEHALKDKKRRGGTITLVIPREIGRYELKKLPVEELAGLIALAEE